MASQGPLRAQWPRKGFQDLTTEVPGRPFCPTFCELSLNEKGRYSLPLQGKCSGLLVHLYASRRHWVDILEECLFVVKEAFSQELWSNLVIHPRRGKAGWLAAQMKALPEKPGGPQKQHHQLRCPHLFFPRLLLNPKALRRTTRKWRKAGWRTDHSPS